MKKVKSVKKCIVKDCLNHSDQGRFVGDLCMPCHTFITTWQGQYSQAYRNSLKLGMQRAVEIATGAICRAFEGKDPTHMR